MKNKKEEKFEKIFAEKFNEDQRKLFRDMTVDDEASFSTKYDNWKFIRFLRYAIIISAIAGVIFAYTLRGINLILAAVLSGIMVLFMFIFYRIYLERYKRAISFVAIKNSRVIGMSVASKYYGTENVLFTFDCSDILNVDFSGNYVIIISKYGNYKVFAGGEAMNTFLYLNTLIRKS